MPTYISHTPAKQHIGQESSSKMKYMFHVVKAKNEKEETSLF